MSGRDTQVFWDLDVRPIPDELLRKPYLIIDKISSTLEKQGYMGEVTIWAYTENMECDHTMRHAYLNAGIEIFNKVNGGKKTVVCKMLADILYFGLNNPPTNLMVISKMNVHMAGILAAMKERKYFVHLVQPDDLADSESEPYDVNTVWTFSSLFEGGEPKPTSEVHLVQDLADSESEPFNTVWTFEGGEPKPTSEVHLVQDLADSESEPCDVWTFSSLFEGGEPKPTSEA